MNAAHREDGAAYRIAAAIGEPARARMLYSLLDGLARTSTELAIVAEVSPSTASVHLQRLKTEHLVSMVTQGKHRYYRLEGAEVASVLEGLSVLAGQPRRPFVSTTPNRLCAARTCYDHIAGSLGVRLHDRFEALRWLSQKSVSERIAYELTPTGENGFETLGIDLQQTRTLRRRFAYPCLDWSERRPHMGGALAAALLSHALKRGWLEQDLDSRALGVTKQGHRDLSAVFGVGV